MLTVAEIMTTDVFTIRSSAKVVQAIALMQEKKVRSLIVEKASQNGAYGILTERDIVYKVTAKSADPFNIMVGEIMNTPCIVVEPTLSLSEVAKRFLDEGIQRAPVIKDGRLVGVVSITDIIIKSNIDTVELPRDWSHRVEVALRHQRLCWGKACDLEQESEAVSEILEELRAKTT